MPAKIIERIPNLSWGSGKDNSFIGSVQATLSAIGSRFEYYYLMGVSGTAFKIHFSSVWNYRIADPTVGFDISPHLFKAVGRRFQFIVDKVAASQYNDREKDDSYYSHIGTIIESIKHNVPVVALNVVPPEDWGVITGYEMDKSALYCKSYNDDDKIGTSVTTGWPYIALLIGGKVDDHPLNELLKESLTIGISLIKTDQFGNFASGLNALSEWKKALMSDEIDNLGEIEIDKRRLVHWTLANTLFDGRASAIKYLEYVATKVNKRCASELLNAKEHYQDECHVLYNVLFKEEELFQTPWQKASGFDWSQRRRIAEADIITECSEYEYKAMQSLVSALEDF